MINIILGDMDFLTLDNANVWIGKTGIINSQKEVENLKLNLEKQIKKDYPKLNIDCSKWSDKYTLLEFKTQYQKAKVTTEEWLTPELLKQSIYPYFEFWGYQDIQKELKLTRNEMETFIKEDLIKTAAQYRLESNKVNPGSITIWAESTSNPNWPLIISNYDKAGIPPSISI
jgi:hypothetical protein